VIAFGSGSWAFREGRSNPLCSKGVQNDMGVWREHMDSLGTVEIGGLTGSTVEFVA
jgi:hypothetical protein